MSAGLTIAIALLALIVLGAVLVTRASGKRSSPPHGGDAGGGEAPSRGGRGHEDAPDIGSGDAGGDGGGGDGGGGGGG